jgi:signal transduction histidine kinase/ActR/RegA family two-component response regulator
VKAFQIVFWISLGGVGLGAPWVAGPSACPKQQPSWQFKDVWMAHPEKGPEVNTQPDWLIGGGDMGELVRALDWSATPLGPRANWPQPLRLITNVALSSTFPMAILWGSDLIFICNDAYREIAYQKHPDAMGRPTRDVWPEVWEFNRPILERVMLQGETVHVENQLFRINRRNEAENAYFTFSYSPIWMEDRTVGGTLVTLLETTHHVIAERETKEKIELERRHLESILEASPSAIVLIEASSGKFTYINRRAKELYGIDYIGFDLDAHIERIHAQRPDGSPYPLQKMPVSLSLKSGKDVHSEEMTIERADGVRLPVLVSSSPLLDAEGKVTAAVVIFEDITERKLAEKTLRRLNETLENEVAERTELAESRARQLQALVSELTIAEQRERRRLADILHDDLQQLLVGAKINSEFLSTTLGTENKNVAEKIQNLISQSLQVSRSLTAELCPTILQQGSLFAALQWLTRWIKETHGLTVDLEADPALDPEREDIMLFLFQSVRELLLNVVKHAGVKSACVEMSQDTKDRLCIAVTDQGTGFDPDRVWEKAKEGTGFGLFSIRERLMLLDGELEIDSSHGSGASFTLFVPSEIKRKDHKKGIQRVFPGFIPTKTRNKIRVLLVDDHTVVRQGLSTMLSQYPDIDIVGQAADGEAAVRMAKKLKPDVILMDISMPKMDGIEATRIINSEFHHIRIIGLSMHDKQDQAARIIEAGASAYCTKDGETANLLSAIRRGGGGGEKQK